MKAMNVKIGGIKCDNPLCDFIDNSISVRDYKNWVNKPCPLCGSNLLKKKDYRIVKSILRIEKIINFLVPEKYLKKDEVIVGIINMDGTGKVDIKID